MKSSLRLSQRVLDYIQKQGLLPHGETVIVGVSGGPDSVCLLHLLASLRARLGIRLHVAHLNHGLRGAESEADALYVFSLSQKLGLPSTLECRDVAAFQTQRHLSLEEAAREVRYGLFSQLAGTVGACRVAVGHTADDQVESILLHLVRGAGLRGLQGMAPVSAWPGQQLSTLWVVRPLLEVSRRETTAYCQEQGLAPRLDASNYSPAYLRNRLRHQLIPLLESLNPAVGEAFLRLGKAATEAVALIEAAVAEAWPQVVLPPSAQSGETSLSLDKNGLKQLPAAIQRHLLMAAWQRLRGAPQDLEAIHIEEMLAALARPAGTQLDLPGGLVFWVDYERLWLGLGPRPIGAEACPLPPLDGEHTLQIPGETSFPGWRIGATILPRAAIPRQLPQSAEGKSEVITACMDFRLAGQELWVRPRRPGDQFQPLGLSAKKKLQDFMVDAKIPRAWRDRVPLVCSTRGLLWVVGYRLAESVKLTAHTEQVLRLEFKPQSY